MIHGVYSGNENNIEEIIDRVKKMAESAMKKTITALISRTNKYAGRERVDAKQPQQTSKAGEETNQYQKNSLKHLQRLHIGTIWGLMNMLGARLGREIEELTGADAHTLIQKSISEMNRDNGQVY